MLIVDGHFQLLFYDRSIVIQSTWTPFVEHADRVNLYKVLNALLLLTTEQWGFVRFKNPITHPRVKPIGKDGRGDWWMYDEEEFILYNGTISLQIQSEVFHQHALQGRGTQVFSAKVIQAPEDHALREFKDRVVALKCSWVPVGCVPEGDILEMALDCASHDPHEWIKDHLPRLLYSEDLTNPGHQVQFLVDNYSDYERRILRISVFEELEPLATVKEPGEVLNIIRQVFACEYP